MKRNGTAMCPHGHQGLQDGGRCEPEMGPEGGREGGRDRREGGREGQEGGREGGKVSNREIDKGRGEYILYQ